MVLAVPMGHPRQGLRKGGLVLDGSKSRTRMNECKLQKGKFQLRTGEDLAEQDVLWVASTPTPTGSVQVKARWPPPKIRKGK